MLSLSIELLTSDTSLSEIIDQLGKLSAVAQNLSSPITSISKLLASDQTQSLLCYIDSNSTSNPSIIGYVKYGVKHLYLYTKSGNVVESDIMCVLDFYVLEESQRHGIGKELFDGFLASQVNLTTSAIAYDRPSSKLYAFLQKHYHLYEKDLDFQPNRYAVPLVLLQQLSSIVSSKT